MKAVIFTYHADGPSAAMAARCLIRAGVTPILAVDHEDGRMHVECCRTIRTSFERMRNLNGKECVLGILRTLQDEAGDDEWVLKVDSDTLVLRMDWLETLGGDVRGVGYRDGRALFGLCYAIRTASIPRLVERVSAGDWLQPNGRPMGEDVIVGTVARELGMLGNHMLYEDGCRLWSWQYNHASMSAAEAARSFDVINVQPADPFQPDKPAVREIMREIVSHTLT